ncbi:MAG: hypothetical protein HYZ71_09650 [Deltaproteobacteria bacterium]|nr:hypothetical protein [Deltaproteobacteria bacterium]
MAPKRQAVVFFARMNSPTPLKISIVGDLSKARGHLEYSFNKAKQIQLVPELDESSLECLESFASRFSRFSEIAVSKYFRSLILQKDPGFRGSVIDLLNQAEKFAWIDSAASWRRIRELRNVAAHDYTSEDFLKLYKELIALTPHLLALSLAL